MTAPAIFDRTARRHRRDRAAARFANYDFLRAAMLEGIGERLAAVTRPLNDFLDLGCFDGGFDPGPGRRVLRIDPGFAFASLAHGIQADEDRLPIAAGSIDCVVSAGVLDQVDDLPGALTLARRVLRPDGLFLGAFLGSGTLPTLRASFAEAEVARPVARVHPQIEVRAAGDLLVRAGFALPVADLETLDVRYAGFGRLLDDLRGMAATNLLASRRALTRRVLSDAATSFSSRADDSGRTQERFAIIYLTGWSPGPDQPQPARRGSATASLLDALRPAAP